MMDLTSSGFPNIIVVAYILLLLALLLGSRQFFSFVVIDFARGPLLADN